MTDIELFRQMILAEELRARFNAGASFAILSREYYLSDQEIKDLILWCPDMEKLDPLVVLEHSIEPVRKRTNPVGWADWDTNRLVAEEIS